MKKVLLILIISLLGQFIYAQENDSSTPQDTVKVMSTEDMQEAEQLYNDGVSAYKNSQYTAALKSFDKAISIKANFPKAYYNRAMCNIELKEYQTAIQDLNNVILLAPNAKAYYLRGTVRVDLDDLGGAKPDFEKAVSIDTSDVKGEASYFLGGIAFENKQYEEAIKHYDAAIKHLPKFAFAYNDRGSAKRMIDQLDAAIIDYEKAIKADPNMAIAYSNMASVKRKKEDLEGAVQDYTSAIKIDSTFVLAYNARGVVYKEMGNYPKALADFDKATELDSKYVFAYNNRGNVYYKMKKYQKAVDDYNTAIKLDKTYGFAWLNRGIAKEMLRDKDGACEDWNQAYKLGIESAKTYFSQCK